MNSSYKIYYNDDIFKLILSYNSCSRCKSCLTKDENTINKYFYLARSKINYIWYKNICFDCLKLQIYGKI